MTNYNKRLDEILQQLSNTVYQHGKATKTNTPFHYGEPMKEAKQALTSLMKELVAEAKPGTNPYFDNEIDDGYAQAIYGAGIMNYQNNLLKELEEV